MNTEARGDDRRAVDQLAREVARPRLQRVLGVRWRIFSDAKDRPQPVAPFGGTGCHFPAMAR